MDTRIEIDTMGPVEVPADRWWGAQTERSRQNFRIGRERMPPEVIEALALIKRAAQDGVLTLAVGQRDDLSDAHLKQLMAGSLEVIRRRLFASGTKEQPWADWTCWPA